MKRWLALGAMVAIGGGVYGMEEETSEKMILVSHHLVEGKDFILPSPKRFPSLKRLTLNVCASLDPLDKEEDFLKKLPEELKEPLRAKMIRKKGDVWQQWWNLSPEDREKEENISLWEQVGKKEFLDIYDILDGNKKENWEKLGFDFSFINPAVQILRDYIYYKDSRTTYMNYFKEADYFKKKKHLANFTEEDLLNNPLKDYLDRRLKEKNYSLRKFLEELGVSTACLPAEEPGLPAEKPGLPAEGLNMEVLFETLFPYRWDSSISRVELFCKKHDLSLEQFENLKKKSIVPLLKLLMPVQKLSISSLLPHHDLECGDLKTVLTHDYIGKIISVLSLKKLKLKGSFCFDGAATSKGLGETPGSFEFLITQMMKNPSLNLKELILEEVLGASHNSNQYLNLLFYLSHAVFQNLEKLSLNRNGLKDEDIKIFVQYLEYNTHLPKLKVLELSDKKITVESINCLMEWFAKSSCFEKLILRKCSSDFKENLLVLPENFKVYSF